MEMDEETKEVASKKRIREEEKEETETLRAERKCVNLVSAEAFEIFSQGDDWERGGFSRVDLSVEADDLSDCDLQSWARVCAVPDVTVVPVFPSSVLLRVLGVSLGRTGVLNRSPLLFPTGVLAFGQFRRDEV